MADIIDFKQPEPPSIIGPRRGGCSVIVDDKVIPRMSCFERGDEVEIVIDDRLSFQFPKEWAYLAAAMAAQAMAVGAGYPSLLAPTRDRPFAPTVVQLGGTETSS